MFLEQLFGSFVSLVSNVVFASPPISRETAQIRYTREKNREKQEVDKGLIHREHEQETKKIPAKLPRNAENIPILMQADKEHRRKFWKSFLRSCRTNIGIIMAAIFIIGLLTVGFVYLDLNIKDVCLPWIRENRKVSWHVRIVQMIGNCLCMLPITLWFPASVIMLWGFQEFKKQYLCFLSVIFILFLSIDCVYKTVMWKKFVPLQYNVYIIPDHIMFVITIIIGVYLVARKIKKINPTPSCSAIRIFFILLFPFLASSFFAYLCYFVIIKNFTGTKDRTKRTVIAALTPVIAIPTTVVAKYLVLRKSWEFIPSDRTFVLCYFIRGGAIAVYRTMQSGFHNIGIFIGLSLLHGASNVCSKATLNLRMKLWKHIVNCFNKTCCGPRLDVRSSISPRSRRFRADLEIQNTIFEYTTIVFSQAYLACYLLINYNIPPWNIVRDSLLRITISFSIDFVFNIISVFIQVHFYDIPMGKVWQKYWRRHVFANAFMITLIISYFGPPLVDVFAASNHFKHQKLRNCTTVFYR